MARTIILLLATVCAAQSLEDLPQYQPAAKVSGLIRIWGHGAAGHDYIETLAKQWEEGFRRHQPDVTFENKLAGTASAIGALYAGQGDLALLGREIWPSEIQASREVWHYEPLGVEVATGSYDVRNKDFALVVFVHKDNPLSKLTMPQLASIFGCGGIRSWGDLGLHDEWANRPLAVYGFEISRGFGYFFQQTVFHGGFKWNPALVEFADERQPDGKLLDAGKRALRSSHQGQRARTAVSAHARDSDVSAASAGPAGESKAQRVPALHPEPRRPAAGGGRRRLSAFNKCRDPRAASKARIGTPEGSAMVSAR